jgi:hypothetical protein
MDKKLAAAVSMILFFVAQEVPCSDACGQSPPLDQNVNISDYATCDGVTDDTAGIQSALNLFTSGRGAVGSGQIVFPIGKCLITSPITYVGSPGMSLHISGAAGGWTDADSGSVILWGGPAGGTMFETLGMSGALIENITFDQAGSARIGLHLAADDAVNTTLGTTVVPGYATVFPGSMVGIAVGTLLSIDSDSNFEMVYVTATGVSTFAATFTKSHSSSALVGGTAGASGDVLRQVYFVGVPNSSTDWFADRGAATAGIVVGNPPNGPNSQSQVSEVQMYNPFVYGNGTCSAGIAFPEGGNAKNFWLYGVNIDGCQYGIDQPAGSSNFNVYGGSIGNSTVADFRLFVTSGLITGVETESSTGHRFLTNNPGCVCGNPGVLALTANSFQSPAPSDDYVIQWDGSLNMQSNQWLNLRTSSSVAKIKVGVPLFSVSDAATITSEGNWYENAPQGYAPLYDGSGNALLPTYYANQPVTVTSLGDLGGNGGDMIKLDNYLTASAITDQGATTVSGAGLIRTSATGCPIGWSNGSGNGDTTLCMNSVGEVQVNGPAGSMPIGTDPVAPPTSTTLGGVEAETCPTNNWVTGVPPTGVPTCAQPNSASLSDGPNLTTLSGPQALSNKNLISSTNTTSLLYFQGPQASIRGNGAYQAVYTWNLPAGTITPGAGIGLRFDVAHSPGVASASYLVKLNGVNIVSFSSGNAQIMYDGELMSTGATTGTLAGMYTAGSGLLSPLVSGSISGLNWASNQVLQVVFEAAKTDYVTGQVFRLNVLH